MYAKIENNKIVFPPQSADNTLNVYSNKEWLIAHGYTDMTAEQLAAAIETTKPVPVVIDYTEFDNACVKFRAVCKQIGQLIGVSDFRGGFDEMTTFQQSEAAQSVEGIQLAIAWSAANELCKYEGKKVGLDQPDWWYRCWSNKPADEIATE